MEIITHNYDIITVHLSIPYGIIFVGFLIWRRCFSQDWSTSGSDQYMVFIQASSLRDRNIYLIASGLNQLIRNTSTPDHLIKLVQISGLYDHSQFSLTVSIGSQDPG